MCSCPSSCRFLQLPSQERVLWNISHACRYAICIHATSEKHKCSVLLSQFLQNLQLRTIIAMLFSHTYFTRVSTCKGTKKFLYDCRSVKNASYNANRGVQSYTPLLVSLYVLGVLHERIHYFFDVFFCYAICTITLVCIAKLVFNFREINIL